MGEVKVADDFREPPIHRAARLGDAIEIGRLLDGGADIEQIYDGPFSERLTPLIVAARSNDGASAETIALLLTRGANPRARSATGMTAAWYAAGVGQNWDAVCDDPAMSDFAERLRCLIDAGLDPNESASNGRSLMVEATASGDPRRVRLLLERGARASPSQKGLNDFAISLFRAAMSGSADCVRLLLAYGTDPNSTDSEGRRLLTVARSPEVVRVLVDAGARLTANAINGDVLDEAFAAIADGELTVEQGSIVAEALVAAGVSLDHPDAHGWSRLTRAAFRERADAVAILLELGASLAPDSKGFTPIHAVCWQGKHEYQLGENSDCEQIIRLLVAAGVPINARDYQQKTPLHKAIRGDGGNATAVRMLLALGAEVDPLDYRGRTPLHRAANHGELDCAEALLIAGADPNLADDEGFTPLEKARLHARMWEQIIAEKQDSPLDYGQDALDEAQATFAALWAATDGRFTG